ncbi:MAG: TetR/AcrR family transcriptional regulator [Bacteroidota bacterium]
MTNKTKILSKSRELFEQYGYQKTTLTDIAKSVGKVKTAIYYYFSGKEEIFASLVQTEAETFNKKLFSKVETVPQAIQKLELYVDTRMQLMEQLSARYSFLKQDFFELLPIVEANRIDSDNKEINYVASIIEEINKSKEIQIDNSLFAAKMLVNTLKGLEIQMYVTNQILIPLHERELFRTSILYGIISTQS